MELHPLNQFTKGWFVGSFAPTLIDTRDVEVAVKHYRAGESEPRHHHKIATEITAIISGTVRMNGRDIGAGQVVKIEPGVSSDFAALTDAITVVVKHPGATHDKYPGPGPTS
jgi:mannose-6-phosphate isomerase-like protein (cupin superfamily)